MDDREDLTALLQAHRVGYLATANAAAVPHVVPVCFVYEAQTIYSALDHKPKRLTGYRMKRIRNILENPHVAFLVHHYAEDWQQLSYVLIQGRATILEQGAERQRALMWLEEKYEQYRKHHLTASAGLVIKIVPETVRRWGWQESATLER